MSIVFVLVFLDTNVDKNQFLSIIKWQDCDMLTSVTNVQNPESYNTASI